MKRLLAILFIVALVWAQGAPGVCVAGASAGGAGRSACVCCHCGKANCCMNKAARQPLPLPAAPAPSGAQPGHLLLLAPAALAFVLPQSAGTVLSLSASGLQQPASIPLYQRNCTFLI